MKCQTFTVLSLLTTACALVHGQHQTAASRKSSEQIVTGLAGGGCGPRIRKSWDMLSPGEKDVYTRAIERAMDDGLYTKFIEIHTEQMTTLEAHRTCMFVYWHRELLLGFENLLRAYGGEFACITIPYWNYVDHNALFMAGACASMEDCSPILRELGGSMFGRTRTVVVNGTPVQGTCVSNPPLNHFCESSSVYGPQCAACVPRGNWQQASFPPTASASSLMRQLFTSLTIDAVATNIEQGIHNTIHNSLGGVMSYLEAPADPVFFSHHATIDLLHSIFYQCAIGNTEPMPLEAKLIDSRQFVACPRRAALPAMEALDRDVLLPESYVMLRSGENGKVSQEVWDPSNPLNPFFAGLPSEYMGVSDIRDIGEYSYNYAMTGLLAQMFTTCGNLQNLAGQLPFTRRLSDGANSTASTLLEAVIIPSDTNLEWYEEAIRATVDAFMMAGISIDSDLVLREVEKMTCMFYDECRGPVMDFSDSFRSSFRIQSSTPCFQIVSDIKSGRDHIRVPHWKDMLTKFFVC